LVFNGQFIVAALHQKPTIFALLIAFASLARAESTNVSLKASSTSVTMPAWDYSSAHWDRILQVKSNTPSLRIGKSDFIVSGALVEGLRRSRSNKERSLGRKFLELPFVRLVVPRPMPSPPGGGKYFCWGESDRSWTTIVAGASAASSSDPVRHEAGTSLISISSEPRNPR